MATLTEAHVIKMMRDEYHRRLVETLCEADMFDDKGNNLLSKGLKVRHRDSGLEYTVDHVEGEKDSGNVRVTLRLPDEPRFQPPDPPATVISDEAPLPGMLGEIELELQAPGNDQVAAASLMSPADFSGDALADDTEFVIDQEEFEKEYEVT